MKHLCASALVGMLLLVVLAPLALAGDLLEGDGYTIEIPDGFVEALSMSGNGTMQINSSIGCLPIDGVPETTIYVYGEATEPRGTIIVARVNLKSGHEVNTLDDLGTQQLEQMNERLPEGFEMKPRKIGKYDAIEMSMEMEVFHEEHTARMVSIAGGDFVMVVMMQVVDDAFPAADTQWEQMVASIKIEKRLSKVVLYGGIGLGALLLVIVFARISREKAPEFAPMEPLGSRYEPPHNRTSTGGARTLPPIPGRAQPTPLGAGAPPPRPSVAAPTARPGLRPTRPSSGRWES